MKPKIKYLRLSLTRRLLELNTENKHVGDRSGIEDVCGPQNVEVLGGTC